MKSVVQHVIQSYNEGKIDKEFTKEMLNLVKGLRKENDDIAIIGMSVRVADVEELSDFWNIIEEGRDCVKDFPRKRAKEIEKFVYHRYGDAKPYYKAAYLDDISHFDYKFFKCTPKEAALMDPNHKIFLETAFRALEDSGYLNDRIHQSMTGIFLGYSPSIKDNYQSMINAVNKKDVSESIPYNLSSIAASRLAYLLDLKGPSMVIDSACSSGLSAIDAAIKSLKKKECNIAIAGGVRLHLLPVDDVNYRMGIESKDGHTRAFDGKTTGSGVGEGSVAIVLKRLSDAEKDNDHIYAVIKGIALNQDGASLGITAPNPESQKQVLIQAWKNAGINPETIDYIETHGTATVLGDPIELNSINHAFVQFTNKKGFCAVGSVKSNLGHLFECAAMVSVVKVVLALNKKVIPKSINYRILNEQIDFLDSSIYVNTVNREWRKGKHPRRCGVSAFGYSGTNGHMVLEEYQPPEGRMELEQKQYYIPFSADTRYSLEKLLEAYETYKEEFINYDISNISWTLAYGRMHFLHRIIVTAGSTEELFKKIVWINHNGLDCEREDIVYSYHKLLTIEKEKKEQYEISIQNRNQLTLEAGELLENTQIEANRHKLMELYCKGADIPWKSLFPKDNSCQIVSLPGYRFDKAESWLDLTSFGQTVQIEYKRKDKNLDLGEIAGNTSAVCEKRLLITGKESLSENEIEICSILRDILGFKEIDVYDNFFELGLDSISMMKVVSAIANQFHVAIDYKVFVQGVNVVKLAELLETSLSSKSNIRTGDQKDTEPYADFELTNIQKAYVLGRQSCYNLGNTSTHMYLEYETELDISKLQTALNKTIQKHPMLRAVLRKDLTQRILKEVPSYTILVDDMQAESHIECEKKRMMMREEMSHQVFDTETWPLFKVKAMHTERKTYLFVGIDLLIADGISLQILLHDLMEYYDNESLEVKEIGYTFKEYIKNYTKVKECDAYEDAKKYWSERLKDIMVPPDLCLEVKLDEVEKPFFARYQRNFGKGSLNRLKAVARAHGVTVSSILCTAYAETLRRWSGQKNFIINIASYNRYTFDERVNDIVGDFTSVMLLAVDYTSNISFWEKVSYIQNNIIEAIQNRYYDGVEIISEFLAKSGEYHKALFPVVFTSVIADDEQNYMNFFGKELFGSNQTPQVFLDNQARAYNGEFMVVWDYVNQVLDDTMVSEMFEYHYQILNQVLNDIDVVSPNNYLNEMVSDYNNTFVAYNIKHFVPQFKEIVKRFPDKVAVVLNDESVTYRELDEKSDKLGSYLYAHNVRNNNYVAVITERKLETIVNMIAVMKAGGAYVPIDISYPEERKRFIIQNNKCDIILTAESYKELNIDSFGSILPPISYSIKDIMYTIYTSGSTGMPKGVVETQEAVMNTIIDINEKYNICDRDKIIGISSFCFDLSVFDVFGALTTGATLVMVKDQRNINNIIHVLKQNHITIWNSVPAIMNLVAGSVSEAVESLRLIMLSGDWIPLSLPQLLNEVAPNAQNVSLGGATEGAIWSIYYNIDKLETDWTSIPYGMPLANQKMFIVNEELEQCPVNVLGEICIGGMGVAKGYCGDEDKTKKVFIYHEKYGMIYRTGDYGALRKSGYIEFLGRRDTQVKVNGYRVELGEIEKRLSLSAGVKEAHVVIAEDQGKSISAFITAEGEINKKMILSDVSKYLPPYMMPKKLTVVEKFELTANGKIDYKALKQMEQEEIIEEEKREELSGTPATETERKILSIIRSVAKNDKLDLNSRIFEIGIDSILLISMITKLNNEFEIDISIERVFRARDIREICRAAEESKGVKKIEIPKVSEKNYYEVSEMQKNLYLSSRGKDPNRAYNIFSTVIVHGKVDLDLCRLAAIQLVERHEALRTSIREVGGKVVQKISESKDFDITVIEVKDQMVDLDKLVIDNLTYFSFEEKNLFKLTSICLEENKTALLFEVHHIVADGLSLHILMEDFIKLYSGLDLAPVQVQFKDYVAWNNRRTKTSLLSKELKYWMGNLRGVTSAMTLPRDYFIDGQVTFEGRIIVEKVPAKMFQQLKEYSLITGVTLFINMFAVAAVVLSRVYRSGDIIVGVPASGRMLEDVKNSIGMFVNTLPIRIQLMEDMEYGQLLEQVKCSIITGTKNQNFSMDQLLKKINLDGTILYDTIFSYQYYDMKPFEISGIEFERYDISLGASKVPLEFSFTEFNDEIMLNLIYSTELFMESSIIKIKDMFFKVLDYVLSHEDITLNKLNQLCTDNDEKQDFEMSMDFNF